MRPKESKNRKIAKKIVADLFTNGAGIVADRIMLIQNAPNGLLTFRDLGGWGHWQAVDAIEKVLDRELPSLAGTAAARKAKVRA